MVLVKGIVMVKPSTSRPWQDGWRAVLDRVVLVDADARLDDELRRLATTTTPHVLAFVNAHAMNMLTTSPAFLVAMRTADTIYRDGSGMASLYKMLNVPPGLNLNGTDLIPRLLRMFDGQPIALFGAEQRYQTAAEERIRREFSPNSELITQHGFLDAAAYLDLAKAHRPRLIVLGMGMPKQETIAVALRIALTEPCLIVCGGAILDFIAGKTARAPKIVQKIGLEWVFRFVQEPKRLFRRYILGNPQFLLRSRRYAASR